MSCSDFTKFRTLHDIEAWTKVVVIKEHKLAQEMAKAYQIDSPIITPILFLSY